MNVREELFANQDLEYKEFHSKLVPTVNPDLIIGVRVPVMRKIAKQAVANNSYVDSFYYEERMIRGFCIGYNKFSTDEKLSQLKKFIPLIDNWAVCDCVCSTLKFAKNSRNEIWHFLNEYKYNYQNEYEIRFVVVMMMTYFLVDDYIDAVLDYLVNIKSDYYYVNMAVAWALSVAFVTYPDKVTSILKHHILPLWVHNKAIQKICESYRVDKETKEKLKTNKRKK